MQTLRDPTPASTGRKLSQPPEARSAGMLCQCHVPAPLSLIPRAGGDRVLSQRREESFLPEFAGRQCFHRLSGTHEVILALALLSILELLRHVSHIDC
jgi:hypothetical protein